MELYNPALNDIDTLTYDKYKPKEYEVKVSASYLQNNFKRNDWVVIKFGKKKIYRIIKAAPIGGLSSNMIWLDYDSKLELGLTNHDGDTEEGKDLSLNRANTFDVFVSALWLQPNRISRSQFRLSFFIAVISTLLALYTMIF